MDGAILKQFLAEVISVAVDHDTWKIFTDVL